MLSRITFYALWARIGHEFFRTSVEFSNGSRVGKAKKCKSKKCKAEKLTTNKSNVRNSNAKKYKATQCKQKNAGLRMESFSWFIIHGNCILFEFLASFSRCLVGYRGNTQLSKLSATRILKVLRVQLLEPSVLMSFLNPLAADCRHLHCCSRRPSPQLLEMAASLRPFASVENGASMQKSDSHC